MSRSKGREKWWVKDVSTKWWFASTSYLSSAISATRLFGTRLPLFSGHSVMFGTAININKLKETFRTKCFPCLIWRCAHGNMAERFPDEEAARGKKTQGAAFQVARSSLHFVSESWQEMLCNRKANESDTPCAWNYIKDIVCLQKLWSTDLSTQSSGKQKWRTTLCDWGYCDVPMCLCSFVGCARHIPHCDKIKVWIPTNSCVYTGRKISTWNVWKGFLCNKSPHDFKRDPVSCITCELWTAQLDHSRVWPPSTVLDSLDHSDHALILILFFEPRSWYFNHQKASRHYVPCMSMLMPRAMCSVTHSEHQLAILAESNSLEGAKRWPSQEIQLLSSDIQAPSQEMLKQDWMLVVVFATHLGASSKEVSESLLKHLETCFPVHELISLIGLGQSCSISNAVIALDNFS